MAPKTLRGRIDNGLCLYEGEYLKGQHSSVSGHGTVVMGPGVKDYPNYDTPHGWGTLAVSPDPFGDPYNENRIKSYEGEWIEGSPNGRGILTLFCGTSYDGEWNWDRSPYNQGRELRWYSWVAHTLWRLKGGQGTMTRPNGTRYEGEWHIPDPESDMEIDRRVIGSKPEPFLHGQGSETWPDGTRYEGHWCEGKLYRGSLTLPDGTRYEGAWQSGYLDHTSHEHDHYVGPIPPDGMRDPARYAYHHRSERDYDNVHGRGNLTRPDGTCSEGEWRNGKLHGQGAETWPDGEQCQGEFRYGAAWRATLTMPDGSRIEYRYGAPVSNLVVPREP